MSTDAYDQLVPMPPDLGEQLRRAARQADESRVERDRLIREAHEAGASLREIERAIDGRVTHVGVKRIIERPPKG